MWLMVVLGARLGALPWGRAPILDPLHRCAKPVCSQDVSDSRVAALNRNCQIGAGRVRGSRGFSMRFGWVFYEYSILMYSDVF